MIRKTHPMERSSTSAISLQASMSKPAPGPKSSFFRNLEGTKADSIHRNTSTHWHLHWYMITRGRPLIALGGVRGVANLIKGKTIVALNQLHQPEQPPEKPNTLRQKAIDKADRMRNAAKNKWQLAFLSTCMG